MKIARIAAIVTLACVAVFLSIGFTRPKPFIDSGLSAEWQCSKTAGILVVCTRNRV
jgi:hypothetical protein